MSIAGLLISAGLAADAGEAHAAQRSASHAGYIIADLHAGLKFSGTRRPGSRLTAGLTATDYRL
ncbi:MAG TPA: hypothetical protein VMN56_20005 [Casimicrobiaceae bacterium]|nr:hypothetical protein [Casimicrobiaceae bacterium]